MSSNQVLYTKETHPHFFLPEEPFPYPFEDRELSATLRDFLKVVREYPAYVETTHSAFYRLVVRDGLNTARSEDLLRMTGREIPAYNSCSSFYGIEPYVHAVVNDYGFQAAQGGRARRKALPRAQPYQLQHRCKTTNASPSAAPT